MISIQLLYDCVFRSELSAYIVGEEVYKLNIFWSTIPGKDYQLRDKWDVVAVAAFGESRHSDIFGSCQCIGSNNGKGNNKFLSSLFRKIVICCYSSDFVTRLRLRLSPFTRQTLPVYRLAKRFAKSKLC